jgi:hypothetical protein
VPLPEIIGLGRTQVVLAFTERAAILPFTVKSHPRDIKAIVLTYDKQVGLAELVVKSYLRLWKECPFQFLVPRNDDHSPHFDFLEAQKNVSIVRTPTSMLETMSVLLGGIDDDAWLYWCIDDRYPIEIDQGGIQTVLDFIGSGAADGLNGIKLIHWRETAQADRKDICIGDRRFRFQVPYSTWGFWHHHFLRAKVLKQIFAGAAGNGVTDSPWALNQHFHKLPLIDGFRNIVFPVDGPIVQFGETLLRGGLLANAREALAQHGCPVPDYKDDPRSILFKTERSWQDIAALKGEAPSNPQPPPFALKRALDRVRAWVQRRAQP